MFYENVHLVFRRIEEHAEYVKNKGQKGMKIRKGSKLDWKSNLIAAKKAKLSENGKFRCWIEQNIKYKSRSIERKKKKMCSLLMNIEEHEEKIIEKNGKKPGENWLKK